ncbi:MAG: hypothetical protein WCG27_01260 [Pseudomonadota bacterium]
MSKGLIFLLLFSGNLAQAQYVDVPKSSENEGLNKRGQIEKIEKDLIKLSQDLNKKEQEKVKMQEKERQEILDEAKKEARALFNNELKEALKSEIMAEVKKEIQAQIKAGKKE